MARPGFAFSGQLKAKPGCWCARRILLVFAFAEQLMADGSWGPGGSPWEFRKNLGITGGTGPLAGSFTKKSGHVYYANTLLKNTNIPACGGEKGKNHFSGFSSFFFFLRGWGGVFNIRRRRSSMVSSFLGDSSGFIGKPSENQLISSCDKPDSARLCFGSQEDALNYARHVVEDSKRRLAAYNLIERYVEGDYYICISEWCRVGGDNHVYDLIVSSVPYKLGDRYPDRAIDVGCLDTIDGDIGDNVYLGKLSVLVCDTHAVERIEKGIPSLIWLERTKKRYDVRGNILAAPLDNGLQPPGVLGEGEIGAFGVGDSRSDSHSIGRVVKRSPEMFNSFGGNQGEFIRERLKKSDLMQIINTLRVTLYDVGPLFCFEKSLFPFFKGKNVFLCARETEF
jgi:hypothetical protein